MGCFKTQLTFSLTQHTWLIIYNACKYWDRFHCFLKIGRYFRSSSANAPPIAFDSGSPVSGTRGSHTMPEIKLGAQSFASPLQLLLLWDWFWFLVWFDFGLEATPHSAQEFFWFYVKDYSWQGSGDYMWYQGFAACNTSALLTVLSLHQHLWSSNCFWFSLSLVATSGSVQTLLLALTPGHHSWRCSGSGWI